MIASINDKIKNNLILKKLTLFVLILILLDFINMKLQVIPREIIRVFNLIIVGFLIVVFYNYLIGLYKNYKAKKTFVLYGHSSIFLLALSCLILIISSVILFMDNDRSSEFHSSFIFIAMLISIIMLTLENIGIVELNSDSILIKDDKKMMTMKNDDLINVSSTPHLIIISNNQEVLIKQGVIIEENIGDLENELKNRIKST